MEEIPAPSFENPLQIGRAVQVKDLLFSDQFRVQIRHAEATANTVPHIDGIVCEVYRRDSRRRVGQIELSGGRNRQTRSALERGVQSLGADGVRDQSWKQQPDHEIEQFPPRLRYRHLFTPT